jgi:hypothetical protein
MGTPEELQAHLSVRRCAPQLLPCPPIGRHGQQNGAMERSRLGSMQRESTAQMAANISRELRELRAALAVAGG